MTRWDRLTSMVTALFAVYAISILTLSVTAKADDPTDDTPYGASSDNSPQTLPPPPPASPARKREQKSKERKYFIPDTNRTDAGVFHVAFVAGGNFYVEPELSTTYVATGNYFHDFGFQGGVCFDYDYSEMSANIPLALRGFVGYKYILSSVNVFDAEGIVRYMIKVSDKSQFGMGLGISSAIWYRAVTDTSPTSSITFFPSTVIEAGFDFTPFMVDFKWLINRIGSDNTIMGWELYFGFRL